ncbi:beta-1,3-galactosyltransferase 5-like isoform X2 [Struthio camelus]|uniref:beta-1,3-galactosyltransferase 5-like isoform X2 n=1 Tax=Struthio camelus TaxID=8801 RepID=UPI003603C7F9
MQPRASLWAVGWVVPPVPLLSGAGTTLLQAPGTVSRAPSPGARSCWRQSKKRSCLLHWQVMHGLKWASEQCRPCYILKTDDDCFVNTDRLPTFLAELNTARTGLYVGSLFSQEKRQVIREPSSKWYVSRQDYRPDKYPPYASGIGYVLSLDAAEKILEAARRVRPIPVEDAYVGILAEEAGVRAKASARFAKHNVRWRVCNYRYLMVIHHLNPREQEAARRSMLQARSACRDSLEVTRWK